MKTLNVDKLTTSELAVAYAASKIVTRTFQIKSIQSKLDEKISETTLRTAVHSLIDKSFLFVIQSEGDEMKDKVLILTFTISGRSSCATIKEKYLQTQQSLLV
jgi:hypothetical protein